MCRVALENDLRSPHGPSARTHNPYANRRTPPIPLDISANPR